MQICITNASSSIGFTVKLYLFLTSYMNIHLKIDFCWMIIISSLILFKFSTFEYFILVLIFLVIRCIIVKTYVIFHSEIKLNVINL